MAASNDGGNLRFWINGFPFTTLQKGSLDAGGMQYWVQGFPLIGLFPAAAGGSLIKTVNGLAIANVKTINGLAIASVKSWNGLTNV